MKTIILIMILAIGVNAENIVMCDFYLERGLKYGEKASVTTSKAMAKHYVSNVIDSLIEAKYACPKSKRKALDESIKEYKRVAKGM